MIDCLVIGGGPAGLTAAIYLARFHLSVIVIDAGRSRMSMIPPTRNHAGFPDGVEGKVLLARMRDQAALYGARLTDGEVTKLERRGDRIVAHATARTIEARAVLLATGVVDVRPAMSDAFHAEALARGRLRYCPICDGFEVTDKRVGVITVQAGDVDCAFDAIYPALGTVIKSELAADLGAEMSSAGCLIVDGHQRTSVDGLYAAGDVVLGLDQIGHAMGGGGMAATTIRNDLAGRFPLRR